MLTRNNLILVGTVGLLAVTLGGIKFLQRAGSGPHAASIVLYEALPHPYCATVGHGAEAYARTHGIGLRVAIGQESTQANTNTNIESLFTLGYRAFAMYPVDPAGSKGLFSRLHRAGRLVVAYGAEPAPGSETSFAVATDTRAAATLAAEQLVAMLGGHGRVLYVFESLADTSAPIRRSAVDAVMARHPGMEIIQSVGDVDTEEKARGKIESALVARGDEVDGVISTGYTTTVAAAVLLSEHNRRPNAKYIHFVGIDTDERVLAAIRDGSVDMTIAQNPFGHGYLACALLDLMLRGWTPVAEYQFVDAGCLPVTKANVDTFSAGIEAMTRKIESELKTKYLRPPVSPQSS